MGLMQGTWNVLKRCCSLLGTCVSMLALGPKAWPGPRRRQESGIHHPPPKASTTHRFPGGNENMLAASTTVTRPLADPCLIPRIRCSLSPRRLEQTRTREGRGGGQMCLFAARPFVGSLRLTTDTYYISPSRPARPF
ncbi:hypothetical protein LZ30DRAFT_728909 [Colletotrichum cereale]|nr:hypothetical protein LZ30DRAFT_728909 [Colletotrichum cereale]